VDDIDQLLAVMEEVTADAELTPGALAGAVASRVGDANAAYQMCLGRTVDEHAIKYGVQDRPLVELVSDLIGSAEFRATLVGRLLQRHESIRRGFFVHVPKTGGTSIESALASRSDWFIINAGALQDPRETTDAGLLLWLRSAHDALLAGQRMAWVVGHAPLAQWTSTHAIRDCDIAFTSLRHPLEVCTSSANYIVRKIVEAPLEPTSLAWSQWLLEADVAPGASTSEIAHRLLFKSVGFQREVANGYARFLGREQSSGIDAFLHTLEAGCTIVPLNDMQVFLGQLGVESSLGRLNTSGPGSLQFKDLDRTDLAMLTERFAEEDLLFYGLATLNV
jgi:hypothetical protein